MKRDFQEEYQNYIESDMPDLWSRIEPNLKEKNRKPETGEAGEKEESSKKKSKVLYFIKRAVPAAACLCALIIGIGVMRISKNNASGEYMMESASDEPSDAGMEYSAETEAVEEAADEEETAMWDESFDGAAMNESAAPAEAPVQDTEESADMDEAASETSKADSTEWGNSVGAGDTKVSGIEASEEEVTVERAVLSGIAVASEEMQEEGYAYAYTFRLEDNSRLIVYLTNEQCRDLEEREVEIKRQAAYALSVFPIKAGESTGDTTVGESFWKVWKNYHKLL